MPLFDPRSLALNKLREPDGRRFPRGFVNGLYAYGVSLFSLIGVPVLLTLAMRPFWEHVGEWPLVRSIEHVLAPVVEKLPDGSGRRFYVGGTLILYVLFLFEILLVLASKRLRFLLLELYDLRKPNFYVALVVLWISLVWLWYIVFFGDPNVPPYRPGRVLALLPLMIAHLGVMTIVAIFGVIRDIRHLRRAHRAQKNKETGDVV